MEILEWKYKYSLYLSKHLHSITGIEYFYTLSTSS